MKTLATTLILSFALIGGAQAATPRGDSDNVPFQGVYGQADNASASRSQVQAELQQAQAAGLVGLGDSDNATFTAQADSGVNRAQVAAAVSQQSDAIAFGDTDNVPFQGA